MSWILFCNIYILWKINLICYNLAKMTSHFKPTFDQALWWRNALFSYPHHHRYSIVKVKTKPTLEKYTHTHTHTYIYIYMYMANLGDKRTGFGSGSIVIWRWMKERWRRKLETIMRLSNIFALKIIYSVTSIWIIRYQMRNRRNFLLTIRLNFRVSNNCPCMKSKYLILRKLGTYFNKIENVLLNLWRLVDVVDLGPIEIIQTRTDKI